MYQEQYQGVVYVDGIKVNVSGHSDNWWNVKDHRGGDAIHVPDVQEVDEAMRVAAQIHVRQECRCAAGPDVSCHHHPHRICDSDVCREPGYELTEPACPAAAKKALY